MFEQEMENQVVKMERAATSQPWGFSIEGGHGSEYFPKDTSIVVTGIANGSPADGILRSVFIASISLANLSCSTCA